MENKNNEQRSILLNWIAFAGVLSLGFIITAVIVVTGLSSIKNKQNVVTVTGSAKKTFKSDLVVWDGTFTAQSPKLSDAYNVIKSDSQKVRSYLISQGIDEKDLVFSSITTVANNTVLPNGQVSANIESYKLSQNVEIRSKDVDRITKISRKATELINQGISFQSNPPQYFFTKIADLKVDMLSLATKDAMTRAQQIAKSTNSEVGKLRAARMGVFQITSLYSTEVSDSGINDTSSIDKEITAVMTCDFEIK